MMMRELDRGEIQDRLPDYVLGTLPEDERRAVEAAVAGDPGLARDLVIVQLARKALTPRAIPIDVDRVVTAIRRPAPARGLFSVGRWRIAAAIATLAIGGASLAVVQRTFHGDVDEPFAVVGESAHVAAAEPLSVTFGYGLSELAADDLEKVMAELEKVDGIPAIEPQARRVIAPPVEAPR